MLCTEVKIASLKNNPDSFKCVLSLHRENAKTLGFLPEGGFKEAVVEDKIIIACNAEGDIIGYLFYNINKRGNFVYIVHLCVANSFRKNGVAKLLFDHLVSISKKEYRGIRVTCRKEFEATKVWKKLGFVFSFEKPGKSKEGSTLFVWWYDFGHPDLFTKIENSNKIKVVLDSNIVYDLMDSINDKNQNSHALFEDWLEEDVEYCITDELKNDISNNNDVNVRSESNKFISQFKIVRSDHEQFDYVFNEIKELYDKPLSSREESDIRHLTRTINSDANYFLTKDGGILKRAKSLLDKYSLIVLRPEEFIIQFSSILNETDYQPFRFSGTNLQIKSPDISELRQITENFFLSCKEKKNEFLNKVNGTLINKETTPFLIRSINEKIAFYVIHEDQDQLDVKFLRYINNLRNKTVVNQLIFNLIFQCIEKDKTILCISEKFVDPFIESILYSYGFIKVIDSYYKFIRNILVNTDELLVYLESSLLNKSLFEEYKRILHPIFLNKRSGTIPNIFNVEKFLFPLKFTNAGLPCFIVPIKPFWAMNLFNIKLSAQDLFGGNERLLFNKENIYYRSARPLTLENKSRILWYFSKGNNRYEDSMTIAASSYLNETEVGKPKYLYKKYNRIGIYSWNNVIETAKWNLNSDIMVFSFDLTENFNTPVCIDELNTIFHENKDKDFFAPQSPYRITEDVFHKIYRLGLSKEKKYEA